MKLLIHTPISNRAWILPEWWKALCSQELSDHDVSILFDVNASSDGTYELLDCYSKDHPFNTMHIRERAWRSLDLPDHQWNEMRYARMRLMRNGALEMAQDQKCDALFSLDSDVLLRDPVTISHLMEAHVPLIAGVFMATWGNPAADALPNVWEQGQNEMSNQFLYDAPRSKSHYRVGGLGACTMIRREVWEMGVSYDQLYNMPSNYRGEDRDFCVRAVAAGFDLMACAHTTIDHVDRPKIKEPIK